MRLEYSINQSLETILHFENATFEDSALKENSTPMIFTVLNLWVVSWLLVVLAIVRHQLPFPTGEQKSFLEVSVCNRVQHPQQGHEAVPVTPLPLYHVRAQGQQVISSTHSLDTQILYRGENQWEPRGQLSGSSWSSSALRCVICLHQECSISTLLPGFLLKHQSCAVIMWAQIRKYLQ